MDQIAEAHAAACKAQFNGTPIWVRMADAFGPTEAGQMMLAYLEAAILAYLAAEPVSEEMVERGAKAMLELNTRLTGIVLAIEPPHSIYMDEARACLTAARGEKGG